MWCVMVIALAYVTAGNIYCMSVLTVYLPAVAVLAFRPVRVSHREEVEVYVQVPYVIALK